jgi:hypothetical protein
LATAACLTGLAHILLHVLEICEICPSAARLGVVAVGPLAYVVALALFVRSKSPTEAYVWALFAPIVVAVIVGVGVIAYTVLVAQRGLAMFGSVLPTPFADLLLFGSLSAAGIGTLGSAILVMEVWAASGARKADPRRGSHRFTAMAWILAACMWALALSVGHNAESPTAAAILCVCAAQLVVQWLDLRGLVARATPANGPYRSSAPTRT